MIDPRVAPRELIASSSQSALSENGVVRRVGRAWPRGIKDHEDLKVKHVHPIFPIMAHVHVKARAFRVSRRRAHISTF